MTIHKRFQGAYIAHVMPEREQEATRKLYKTAKLVDSVQSPSGTTLAAGTFVGVAYQNDRIYAIYKGIAAKSELIGYCHEMLLTEFVL
jgi:hypothetical protein